MSEVLDPVNKALRVRIRLNNEGLLLKPEMFAQVLVSNTEDKKAICISSSALITDNGKDYVVRYINDKDMKVVEVNILKNVGDKTYLNSGLKEGDKLITQNQLLIFQQLQNEVAERR